MAEWVRRWDLRKLVTLAVAVVIVATASTLAVGFARGDLDQVGPLASLKELKQEGVIHLVDERAFLVYFEGDLLALSADAQHLGDTVEYCPTSQLFWSRAHGEKFDIRGIYYGGPATRSLARFATEVREGWIYVDLAHPVEGPERDEVRPRKPQGPLCIPT